MRTNKEEQTKINDARVRNMLETLPKIRCQMAGYYDDLRKIEHEVYAFNERFSDAIRAICAVERFYPGEEKPIEEKPKSNIIRFPAPAGMQAPIPAERPAPYEEPKLSFAEHCEAFKGVDFGGNPTGGRILWALYRYRIHSIEELARTPAAKLQDCRRIGPKSVERIRAALRSSGIVSEACGIPEADVTQQEN